MRISVLSIPVSDQEHALQFYTKKLGFLKKLDIPLGGDSRWLTLVAPDVQDGAQLLLEPGPLHFEPAKVFQQAVYEAGMPWTQFDVDDCQAEYERLIALDVTFSVKPTEMGAVKIAVFDDTCGNRIQIVQHL